MEVFSVLTEHLTEATTHLRSRVSTILLLRGPSNRRVDTAYAMPAWQYLRSKAAGQQAARVHDRSISGQRVGQLDATPCEAKHRRTTDFITR